jgi:chaperonin GroEL (HSP60 family)
VHPTSIIGGLNLAKREACKFVAEYMSVKTESLPKDYILNVAKTSMSSKIIGAYVPVVILFSRACWRGIACMMELLVFVAGALVAV